MRPCEHGFSNPKSCWDCMEDGNLEPVRPDPPRFVMSLLTARFDGHCESCNLGIHVGQSIVRLSDQSYRHEDCWP